jgi:hypothetical protein
MQTPTFNQARNLRQKARAARLNPNCWYAVEYDRVLKPGQVIEVKFWNRLDLSRRTGAGQSGKDPANSGTRRQGSMEMNPAVPLFQQLIVRKWEDYCASARKDRVPSGVLP